MAPTLHHDVIEPGEGEAMIVEAIRRGADIMLMIVREPDGTVIGCSATELVPDSAVERVLRGVWETYRDELAAWERANTH